MNQNVTSTHSQGRFSARMIAVTGITAALYAVLTMALPMLSYNAIQLRFSEILVLLAYLNPSYWPGLVLGCFIANFFRPNGLYDIVFGTLGTVVAVWGIIHSKRLFVATLWPTISMFVVSIGIALAAHIPYLPTVGTTMLGEFAVVTCIGYPVFRLLLKNQRVARLLGWQEKW